MSIIQLTYQLILNHVFPPELSALLVTASPFIKYLYQNDTCHKSFSTEIGSLFNIMYAGQDLLAC